MKEKKQIVKMWRILAVIGGEGRWLEWRGRVERSCSC